MKLIIIAALLMLVTMAPMGHANPIEEVNGMKLMMGFKSELQSKHPGESGLQKTLYDEGARAFRFLLGVEDGYPHDGILAGCLAGFSPDVIAVKRCYDLEINNY